jgi:5'-nucleotidase/UDP-sugar diphosphatase
MFHLKRLLALSCYSLLLVSPTLFAETAFRTHLIHINDHHSHLVEENYDLEFDGVKTRIKLGGFARIATKIKELRNRFENPMVFHIGDAFQGTVYYSSFKGEADVKLMNMVGFDAFVLGNHEFDDGNAALSRFIQQANFPILAANIDFSQSQDLKGLVKPYLIKNIGEHQVGIIGINSLKTLVSSSPGKDLTFHDEVTTTREMVQQLEKQGINKIILLTHYGYTKDQILAQQVAGVDVILGGDSHTLLGDFSQFGLVSEGAYPTKITSPNGEPVCIAHAWQYSYLVGSLQVSFDDKGVVTECQGNPILLIGDSFQQRNAHGDREPVNVQTQASIEAIIANNPNIEIVKPDPEIMQQLATYTEQVDKLSKEVIGQAAEDLLHIRIPGIHPSGIQLPYGSLIAPLVAEAFLEQLNSRNYGVELVIQNGGGVRIDVLKGAITMEIAYTLLPFSNTLYVLELTGDEIKQTLEESLSNYFDKGGSSGSFPYAAGIRYTIEVKRPIYQRVTRLEIRDEHDNWLLIVPTHKYQVGTNSFVASGRDGYITFGKVLTERGGVNTYFDYAESFVNYVKKVGTLKKQSENELTFLNTVPYSK